MSLRTAAAASLAALVLPAGAATSSSVTLSNYGVTLIDLNPADGIDAAITFHYSGFDPADFLTGNVSDTTVGQTQVFSQGNPVPLTPTSLSIALPAASAHATVSGDGTLLGSTLSIGGSALGATQPGAQSSFGVYADLYAPFSALSAFTLSANTLALFSVTATLEAQTSHGMQEWSDASAEFAVGGLDSTSGGTGYQEGLDRRYISAATEFVQDDAGNWVGRGQHSLVSATLAVSFANTSGADLDGYLWSAANIYGMSSVPAVPEPGTWALMLCGIAAVGVLARRRRWPGGSGPHCRHQLCTERKN